MRQVPHARHHGIDFDVVGVDGATWVRPGSGNVLGQFVRDRMNEPYLLGKPRRKKMNREENAKGRRMNTKRKTERRGEKPEGIHGIKQAVVRTFSAWMVDQC